MTSRRHVLLAGLGAALLPGSARSAPSPAQAAVDALLALSLPDSQGRVYRLDAWPDTLRILNFWATWCPPCRRELPEFARVARALSGRPIQFLGIAIDEAERVAAFEQAHPPAYPSLIGQPALLQQARSLGNPGGGLPFTLFIDRTGRLREVKLGALNGAELERKIQNLL